MFDTLINQIIKLGDLQPDKLAIAFKKEKLTYGELKRKMVQVSSSIADFGVTQGDRILISATSKPETVVTYLAVHYLGAVVVLVDKNISDDNAVFIYQDANAKIFFTDKLKKHDECKIYSLRQLYTNSGSKQVVYKVPEENDLAEMIYTSGTTGYPKGVMLTYCAVYNIWTNTIAGVGMRNDDRVLLPLPLNHSFALRVLRAGLYLGATVILQNGFTFARDIENNLDEYNCTAIAIVPASVETISRQMQEKFADIMGRFRYIEVSAGSLSSEQRKRLSSQLPETVIINTWGSSESGGALFLNVTEEAKSGDKIAALGKPLDCVEVKTLDEQGKEFKSDKEHPGRMALKGSMQMAGYWNNPELTAETLKDGWLLTGDMVYIDEDGYLYMLGRADDIINVGGEKVSPVEVENVAGEYENISECACIGVPDPEGVLGFVPVLFLVPRNNKFTEDGLKHFLSGRIEKYKIPVKCVELIELPRNSMQKIDRKALRAFWEKQGGASLLNETVHNLLTRRSIRKFTDEPIPKEILEIILMTGYYAPSGHNMQTWKFTVLTKDEDKEKLKEAATEAAKANNIHFYGWENPAVIVLVSNDNRNPDSCQDASCATENIMISAWSYGIGSVWLNPLRTLRNTEPVKALLDSYGIPENHTIWSTIALGYPVAEGTLLKKKTNVIEWIE